MSRSLIAALVVVCLLSHAQVLWAQPVSAGIKAGVSAASMPGATDAFGAPVDEESRWGGTSGVFVTIPLNDLVAFQPEALYVAKGATLVGRATGSPYSLAFDVSTLEIPLFFRFGRSTRRLYFLAGPSLGFRLAFEGRETVFGVTETRDLADEMKAVDVGIAFGAGATLGRVLIEGRWTEGLRDVESGDQFATAIRHRVLTVLAGFRF